MGLFIHLFFIANLGIVNFNFTSPAISTYNLVKSTNHVTPYTVNFSINNFDYATLKVSYEIITASIVTETIEKFSKSLTHSKNQLQEIELRIQQANISQLESLKKISQLKIVIVICLFSMLLISFFLILTRLRNILQKKRLVIRLQIIKRLEDKLYIINKDLTDFSLDITRKNKFIQEICDQLKQLKKRSAIAEKDALIQELIIKTHNQLKSNEGIYKFQQNIEKVNHAFFEKISTQFKNLTTNEIHLCGLIRLGLTIKDIAAIKNISPKSVEMNRYRLRKKIGLIEGQDLNQFLLKI